MGLASAGYLQLSNAYAGVSGVGWGTVGWDGETGMLLGAGTDCVGALSGMVSSGWVSGQRPILHRACFGIELGRTS